MSPFAPPSSVLPLPQEGSQPGRTSLYNLLHSQLSPVAHKRIMIVKRLYLKEYCICHLQADINATIESGALKEHQAFFAAPSYMES